MGKKINLTGQKFGRLLVIKDFGKVKKGEFVKWYCKCDCGRYVTVASGNLKNGNTKSCGCYRIDIGKNKKIGGANKLKLQGERFGKLLVIDSAGTWPNRQIRWNCVCDCGKKAIVPGSNLVRGTAKSCGCYRIQRIKEANTTHGNSINKKLTDEYQSWISMQKRCYDKKSKYYENWGGRGIFVCDRWLGKEGFDNFLLDMGRKPSPDHSLDRYPNNKTGIYEPSNCRWATAKEQTRNRRSNVWIDYNGKKMILKDWIEFLISISNKGL